MDADYKQHEGGTTPVDADYYEGTAPYTIIGQDDGSEHRFLLIPQGEKLDLRKTKCRVLDLGTGKLYRPTPITQLITQGGPWHQYNGSQEPLAGWLAGIDDQQPK